jgi:hypothetical protein
MTLIKKRDVKSYFAAKSTRGSRIHIVPTSQPDATGFSGDEPVIGESTPADFNQDFTTDHSSPSKTHPTVGDSSAPSDPQASAAVGRIRR